MCGECFSLAVAHYYDGVVGIEGDVVEPESLKKIMFSFL